MENANTRCNKCQNLKAIRFAFLITGLFLLIPNALLRAQNTNSTAVFEAYADAKQVLLNNYFEVTFTLKNADGRNFSAPSFNDFVLLSGPSRGMETSIINGRVSKKLTYTYTLQPRKVGKFMVGSASITLSNNTVLRSKPFRVEVLKGKEGEQAKEQQYFVKAMLSKEEAFVGQQVRLDYKLFTTVEVINPSLLKESDYIGFYAEDIKRPDSRKQREIIDGVQYVTQVLRSVALYPQQAGALKIDPAHIQLGVVLNNRRKSNFFFGSEVKHIPVQTEALSLNVKSLPANRPASFSGAVGNFRMATEMRKTTLTTDDVLELYMLLEGDGDIKRISPPDISIDPSFTAYEPKILEEEIGERSSSRIARKRVEYIFQPKKAGSYSFQPQFTYYNPDSSKYISLKGPAYQVTVRKGSAIKQPLISSANNEMETLHPLKSSLKLYSKRRFFFGSTLFWILFAIPVLLLIAAFLYRNRLQKIANLDPSLLKMQKANQVALGRLEQAKSFMETANSRAFYDEISKAMLGYISDKLKIPRSEMTKHNMKERLDQLKVEEAKVAQFVDIVKNCEMALFAGQDNAAAMEKNYNNAFEVIAAIEKQVTD